MNYNQFIIITKKTCDMTTVKIKFRPSTIDGKEGTLFYQVIHNRVVRQQKSNYHLYSHEWDKSLSQIIDSSTSDEKRKCHLRNIDKRIKNDIITLQKIISGLQHSGCHYSADDVIAMFESGTPKNYLFPFMEDLIITLRELGRVRTSETYAATLSSFKRFRNGKDLSFDEMDSGLIMEYEAFLQNNGVCPNSSSFYMRNLRAVYNRAVDKELTIQRNPFKHVYTGIDKTVKRAIPLKSIKQIKGLDLSAHPTLDFARDMFIFSFYTRGMSFIDMAYLKKKDLSNGILSYRRRKTGQQLSIKWEKCMQEIVDKYKNQSSKYLMPIIDPQDRRDERNQYIRKAHMINRSLKAIGKKLQLTTPLTMYVSRHAWASIARSKNIPISVISEGMGHDSEATTRIYLASLDTAAIDKANSMILRFL